jgi:hypothetical protein
MIDRAHRAHRFCLTAVLMKCDLTLTPVKSDLVMPVDVLLIMTWLLVDELNDHESADRADAALLSAASRRNVAQEGFFCWNRRPPNHLLYLHCKYV